MNIGKLKLDMPHAVVASVAIAASAAVYLLAPNETRELIHKAIVAVWLVAATFLPALIRTFTDDDDGGES